MAWLLRASGAPRVEAALTQTLAFIDGCLTDPQGALYEDDLRTQPRRQNPQMHWFEAMLALDVALICYQISTSYHCQVHAPFDPHAMPNPPL